MNNILIPKTREEALFLVSRIKPYMVLDSLNPRNYEEVFTSPLPSLAECEAIRRPDIRNLAEEYVTMALVQAQRLLNVSPKLEDAAIRKAASYILEDYAHLSIADLALCTKLGIKGQLGTFYGRLDAQVVYDWFYLYNIRRDEAKRYWEAAQGD